MEELKVKGIDELCEWLEGQIDEDEKKDVFQVIRNQKIKGKNFLTYTWEKWMFVGLPGGVAETLVQIVERVKEESEDEKEKERERKFAETLKFHIPVYSDEVFGFHFQYVNRAELDDAVYHCEYYIKNLLSHQQSVHASYIRYLYIGGASGAGKTRLAFEIPRRLSASNTYEVLYVFVDGVKCLRLSVENPQEKQAREYTKSLLLSILLPGAVEFEITFPDVISRISQDCFSSNPDTRKVLYIHIDECQVIAKECQAILRTIRELTRKGNLPFVIIPVLSGISILNIATRDLVEVSGMSPIPISLCGMQSGGLTNEFLRELGIDQEKVCSNLDRVILDMGGVPRYFQFLADILRVSNYHGEPITIDFAQIILRKLIIRIEVAYPYPKWLERFGSDSAYIRKFITLAIGGVSIPRDFRINGSTLKDCAESGLFSLMDNQDGTCQVFLPLVIVQYLNSKVFLCEPQLLDPFNTEWSCFEAISVQSLWFRIGAFQIIGKSKIKISDLRCGCLARQSTLDVVVDISEKLAPIMTLARHIADVDDTNVPTGTDGSGGTISLLDGLNVIRCFRDQPAIDGLLISSENSFRLLTQSKTSSLLKSDGTPSSVSLYIGEVASICQKVEALLLPNDNWTSIIEVFTDHSSHITNDQIPASTIIITRANLKHVVGPVFGQRLRTRSFSESI